jgi:hypothetical protein
VKAIETGNVGTKALCLQEGKCTGFNAGSFSTYTLIPPLPTLQKHLSNSTLGIDNSWSVAVCSVVSTTSNVWYLHFPFKVREQN